MKVNEVSIGDKTVVYTPKTGGYYLTEVRHIIPRHGKPARIKSVILDCIIKGKIPRTLKNHEYPKGTELNSGIVQCLHISQLKDSPFSEIRQAYESFKRRKMVDKRITISKQDRRKLADLMSKAQNTPAISFQLGKPSMADVAWATVKRFMDSLGKRYGYDPSCHAINNKTGEVVPTDKKMRLHIVKGGIR